MAAEPGDEGRVDGMVEPIRRGLVAEQRTEYGGQDRATSQQSTRPGTGGVGQ
jgi:hypothetical protein